MDPRIGDCVGLGRASRGGILFCRLAAQRVSTFVWNAGSIAADDRGLGGLDVQSAGMG